MTVANLDYFTQENYLSELKEQQKLSMIKNKTKECMLTVPSLKRTPEGGIFYVVLKRRMNTVKITGENEQYKNS